MERRTSLILLLVLVLALSTVSGLSILSSAHTNPISGAIFTTDKTGLLVNGNIYEYGTDVYLSGGPGPNAPPTAAGLPDGEYYFQVTDPPGKRLLSTDNVKERKFLVNGGIITKYLGTTHKWNPIPEIPGAIVIQLWPFDKTPNKGGVYKAWATPVEDYDPTNPHSFWGFIPRYSKTDNYKVRITKLVTLTLDKFYDVNNNGIYDDGDYLIEGWRIDVKDPLGVTNTYYTPRVIDVTGNMGTYIVTEELPAGWVQTAVAIDGTYIVPPKITVNVNIPNGGTHSVLYGNRKLPPRPAKLILDKFNDVNGNGVYDTGDVKITDWRIDVTDPHGGTTTYLTPKVVEITEFGTYAITEDLPVGWEQTAVRVDDHYISPPTATVKVSINEGETHEVLYGNKLPPPPRARLVVEKFNDTNRNGVFDGTDVMITGWKIYVTDPHGVTTTYLTPVDLAISDFGTYTIREDLPAGWEQTALFVDGVARPPSVQVTVDINAGDKRHVLYGNHKIPPPPKIRIGLGINPLGDIPVCTYVIFSWKIVEDPPGVTTPQKVTLTLTKIGGTPKILYEGSDFPKDFTGEVTWHADEAGNYEVRVRYDYLYLGKPYYAAATHAFTVIP